jgi:nucleoside-diphosphate-sugar epimerase
MPNTQPTPEGSYGCGKLVAELLVNEYSRRGFVDGITIRLPTIVVRPGAPSPATSAAISGIIREPLHGVEAICPYGNSYDDPALDKLEVWVCSPQNVIDNFVIASHVPAEKFPSHSRVVNLPGFTVTVKQELEALKEVAGQA